MRRNTGAKLAQTERRRKVAELRKDGASQTEIATALEIAQGTVSKDLRAVFAAERERAIDAVRELRERELENLEAMETEAVSRLASSRGHRSALGWFNARLKVQERRAKLVGLDAPERKDIRAEVWRPHQDDDAHLVRTAFEAALSAGISLDDARLGLIGEGMDAEDATAIYNELKLREGEPAATTKPPPPRALPPAPEPKPEPEIVPPSSPKLMASPFDRNGKERPREPEPVQMSIGELLLFGIVGPDEGESEQ